MELQIPIDFENTDVEDIQLPDPALLEYYRLAEHRIFYVDYEINMNILEIQRELILINIADEGIPINERVPIIILIDSPGGLLSETMCVACSIMQSKTPVITVNIAEAYSGGALLLLAGHKRYALPYSKAMIHTGFGSMSGTFEQAEERQKLYKKEVDEMGKYILERSGMDKRVFNKNKAKDWYMTTDEQLRYGLVHEIGNLFDILHMDLKEYK